MDDNAVFYAVWIPCDQTIAFVTQDGGNWTTSHKEAGLWDSWEKALDIAHSWGDADIEVVADAPEFRSREDTW